MNDQTIAGTVGHQLDGQFLYEKQKLIRLRPDYLHAPTVIATNLKMADNTGGVLRIADAAGCQSVIFLTDTEQPHLTKMRRTAKNSDMLLSWQVQTHADVWAEDSRLTRPLIAIELTSHSTSLFETQLPQACTFVIGNERHGIPKPMLQKCDEAIHIPMYGVNGSMNVTHALAIVLFEWRRQHAPM